MDSHSILEIEETALADGLKAVSEKTYGMNDYYKSVFLHDFIMEVLCVVIGNMGSGCARFREGGKTVGWVSRAPICTH